MYNETICMRAKYVPPRSRQSRSACRFSVSSPADSFFYIRPACAIPPRAETAAARFAISCSARAHSSSSPSSPSHVATLSAWGLNGGAFEPSRPYASVAAALRSPAVKAFYLSAIVAVSYHLANGLFTGAGLWGLVRSDEGKRRWRWVCAALGISLASLGSAAWYAF